MKVTEHIKNAKSALISFEVLPPLKGKSIHSLFEVLDPLMEFRPPFIDVTYHREEYLYKKRQGGYFEKVAIRKRPGTVGICAAIMNRYKVDAVPHLTCGGFSRQETEDALIDLSFLGIDNVLLIRGDPAKPETTFTPDSGGHPYAIDLVRQVVHMNKGIYLEEDLLDGIRTNFCIGVAGYPEKHAEAPNLQADLKYLKAKVEAGADYIVTQMFFDNRSYFSFVDSCREAGITAPVIPGIKPITTRKQVLTLPRTFHTDIPPDLYNAVEKCKSDEDATEAGIEWSVRQSKELISSGVPCLHFYTMSKPGTIARVVKAIL